MRRQIQKAYQLTTEWQQLEPKDANRKGTIVQLQSVNADKILISEGRPTSDFAAIELLPSGDLYEDILPPLGEIWAKARSNTPVITLVLKY